MKLLYTFLIISCDPAALAAQTCNCPGDITGTDTTPSDGLEGGNGVVNAFALQAANNELLPCHPTSQNKPISALNAWI